ncbi:MAG: hypothetical protein J5554_03980 [Paludibacteraceae bacterium]|nr:hypothetical protein [Paludibacteraceae bacterium]
MKSIFWFFLGWLFCSGVFAQADLYKTFYICRQSDTVHLEINKTSYWKASPLTDFFSGVFFKRVDQSVLKLPTRSYKDRFLKCENCEIVNYSVNRLNAGQLSLKGLDLLVEPAEKTVFLTTTSKSGDTLSRLTVLLSPKMTFYLKINDIMVKIDPSIPMPDFRMEDKLSIVARAENGEKMKVVDHFFRPVDSFIEKYSNDIPIGDEVQDWMKNKLLPRRRFALQITFSDDKGNEWETNMQFFKWEWQ